MRRMGRAFTLVEVMVTVAVIGVLLLIAIPVLSKARMSAVAGDIVNDLRAFYGAFQQFNNDFGSYPPIKADGSLDARMAGYLDMTCWEGGPGGGGHYKWLRYEPINEQVIYIAGGPGTETMQLVDERLDDGNLTSTAFRQATASDYVYILDWGDSIP
ncbi:MAG: prepilin-type N-terminal cleavage/methylation domain-containing protein [Verrucomicrobia bacterium]|nr:prepilin-type N-terminal cleavage/methylation domain-containing protein [Verrucomicrobiota bacterium]